jgi:hypothetical protein
VDGSASRRASFGNDCSVRRNSAGNGASKGPLCPDLTSPDGMRNGERARRLVVPTIDTVLLKIRAMA